ncbi:hypothetical protein ACFX59_12530 [Sphingomonas sp. NCPPB 2930]|uniref:hypothetical protein n=1 Tax=Sphingomonas sp. NCPPB 2930 TaxID=3162788 RepID=UPI0036D8E4AA
MLIVPSPWQGKGKCPISGPGEAKAGILPLLFFLNGEFINQADLKNGFASR